MPALSAAARARPASRDAMPRTVAFATSRIAGITRLSAIIAGLRTPQRTFSIVTFLAREADEVVHHPLVDLALERDHQLGKVLHRLPAPRNEFRLVRTPARGEDVDLAVIAGEAQRIPFLRLPAVAPLPDLLGDIRRQIVGQPLV